MGCEPVGEDQRDSSPENQIHSLKDQRDCSPVDQIHSLKDQRDCSSEDQRDFKGPEKLIGGPSLSTLSIAAFI